MIHVIMGVSIVGVVWSGIMLYLSLHGRIEKLPTYASLDYVIKAAQAQQTTAQLLQKQIEVLQSQVAEQYSTLEYHINTVHAPKSRIAVGKNSPLHDTSIHVTKPIKVDKPKHRKYKK